MPTGFDQQDVSTNKVYGILAYLGILVLVPILVAKDSEYAKFHSNQGVVLLVLELGASIGGTILTFILGLLGIIPFIGWIFGILAVVVGIAIWGISIACLVFMIIGIINACNGERKELPIIGKYQLLK